MTLKIGRLRETEKMEKVGFGGEEFLIPKPGLADIPTRLDELMIVSTQAIVKAVKQIEIVTNFLMPKTWTQDPVELKRRLVNGEFKPHEYVGGNNGLDMTVARTDAEFSIEGDTISWATKGTLEGVTIRLNHPNNPPIQCDLLQDWREVFYRIFVTHTAQAGKTLFISVGRESSASGVSQTIYTELKNKVSAVLDSSTANINNGATYTGTAFSVEEYGLIAVSLFADRNLTLYIDQLMSPNTNYDVVESGAYVANATPGFYTQVYGHQARIRIANASGSNTTALRMYAVARRT